MIIYDSTGLDAREFDQLKDSLSAQYLRHGCAGLKPNDLEAAKEEKEEEDRQQ